MYKTFHWVPAGNINMNTARLVMNRNIVTRQVSLKPLTQAETEKVKVTKRELLKIKIKNGRQALLNRRYSSSSGLFLSSEAAETDLRLAISIKDQTQDGYRDIKRLKAAGLGEGRTMERERERDLNEEDPRGISLPKAENGFDHVVCLERPELNSRSRTQ